jgi:hypothetical protein
MPRTRPTRRGSTGLLSRLLSPKAAAEPRRPRRHRLAVEALEGRQLLSLYGSQHLISTNPQATDNTSSANASSANGTSVAVWVNAYLPTDHDVWAQRFDKYGQPAGAPIAVDYSFADSYAPRVAMDALGRFVVAYEDANPDGTDTVMMRYFSAAGKPLTNITQVTPAGESDYNPSVAASNGSFVISWTHLTTAGVTNIDAERFTVAHNVPTGQGPFAVIADANDEDNSCVAMAPGGQFDIAFQRQFVSGDDDIFASQYDGSGHLLRGLTINADSNDEVFPSLAMDNAGNAVVAYQETVGGTSGIYADRLSSGGVVGGQVTVQGGALFAGLPSVALAATGGQYVVAYYAVNADTTEGVEVTEVGSGDSPMATFGALASDPCIPGLSIDGLDSFMVTFQSVGPTGHEEIYSVRDLLGAVQRVSTNPGTTDNRYSAVASSANGTAVVVWTNWASPGPDVWAQRLDKYGQPAGAPIPVDTTGTFGGDLKVAMDAQGRFVVAYDVNNPDGTESIMMRYYSASGKPLTGITQVSLAGSTDYSPSVAASNGSFVIAWTHQTTATLTNIEAERFTVANNVPTGQGPFAVIADGLDIGSCVAMAPDGRFDIAYLRGDLSGLGISASQYDSSGNLLLGDIPFNVDVGNESVPAIAMDDAGNAVVAYKEWVGTNLVVFANRLSAGGVVGGVITVQALAGNDVSSPSVALSPTGGLFVVAYWDAGPSNTAVGITEVGSNDAPLDTTWVADAYSPSVSIDGFGRYTVTYTQYNWTANHDDIYSKRSFLS